MAGKVPPFEAVESGEPVWRLQVDDPVAAAGARHQFNWAILHFPAGSVLAMVLRVHDGTARPLMFHHALLLGGQAARNLGAAATALLIFERHGFISDARAHLPLGLSALPPASPGDQVALAHYVEAYKAELPVLGSPEAVWAAIETRLHAPASTAPKKEFSWIPVLVLLGLLFLLGLAYTFWKR
jgi:hypothetical protein